MSLLSVQDIIIQLSELQHIEVTPLGLETIPGISCYPCPETPNSLIEQGKLQEARKILEKIRGTSNEDAEYEDMIDESISIKTKKLKSSRTPFKISYAKETKPQLVIGALAILAFQQLTGNNSILFYTKNHFH
ncbi:sugar transport protein 14-like [Senna tora]|uniref:Sugar transport protein 14-like n=1 Tax=Senna tora TaxID=362788 RepID=A0A834X7U6_9FABA|nr:sugar transport protein 14-like [Senna tora]